MFENLKKAARSALSTPEVQASQATIAAANELDQTLAQLEGVRAKQSRVQELDRTDAKAQAAEQQRIVLLESDPERKAMADKFALGEGERPAKIDRGQLEALTESRAVRAEALERLALEIAEIESRVRPLREAFIAARAADFSATITPKIQELKALAMRAATLAWQSPNARAEFETTGCALVHDARDHVSVVVDLGDAFPALAECLPPALPARVASTLK